MCLCVTWRPPHKALLLNQIEDLVGRIRFFHLSWSLTSAVPRVWQQTHKHTPTQTNTHNALSSFSFFFLLSSSSLCPLCFTLYCFEDYFISGFKKAEQCLLWNHVSAATIRAWAYSFETLSSVSPSYSCIISALIKHNLTYFWPSFSVLKIRCFSLSYVIGNWI